MIFRRSLPGALLLLASCGGSAPPTSGPAGPTDAPLPDRIRAIIDQPPVNQVHWGILVVDPATDEVLVDFNAHRKFVPASNQKILVTAAGLSLLGPEYRWGVPLYTTGARSGETLAGDLVLHGNGDPTLGEPFHDAGAEALEALADEIAAAGVREVQGALVVDVSRFDSTSVPGSWMQQNLPWSYSATGGGFVLNQGEVRVGIHPGATPGDPVEVNWAPMGTEEFVTSDLTTLHADSSDTLQADYLPESRRLVLRGGWPAADPDSLDLAMRDPIRQSASALLRALEARGMEFERGLRIAWTPESTVGGGCPAGSMPVCPGAKEIARLDTPPMAEVVPAILEPSQNWMTDQLLMTLGREFESEGSRRAGFRVLGDFLTGIVGADSLDFFFQDGSGMSAYNLVTPRGVVAILDYMDGSEHGALYRDAMAEPMEPGSTLRARMDGLQGQIYAKTGTINHVNSLSGYAVTSSGRRLTFSILSNGSGLRSSTVRQAIDAVAGEIARTP
jgi:D-alanyl-D-alanine carboxypeptidase/D-alanyl-D-alanine-endopeptidase (penicillin-binding protein 4)